MPAVGGDKEYIDMLTKETMNEIRGLPDEQCPICGNKVHVTKNIRFLTKEALFQNTYGVHYVCARDADTPAFKEFELEWTRMNKVNEARKQQLERGDAAIQQPPVMDAPTAAPPAPATEQPVAEPTTGEATIEEKPEDQPGE